MQAAAAVVDAHDAGGDESLRVLTSIAQNFPMQVDTFILCYSKVMKIANNFMWKRKIPFPNVLLNFAICSFGESFLLSRQYHTV